MLCLCARKFTHLHTHTHTKFNVHFSAVTTESIVKHEELSKELSAFENADFRVYRKD